MNHPPNNNNINININADNDNRVFLRRRRWRQRREDEAEEVGDNAVAAAIEAAIDGANNNNNEDEDDNDGHGGDDDDEDEDEDIFDPAEMEQICTEAMTLLQNRLNFPSKLRDRTIVRFAQQFINNVKEDIHETITDTRTVDEGYDGLDSDRDSEEEVATAIRCCPEVLTRRDDRFGWYPIQCSMCMIDEGNKVVCNLKAVSFVPLFARLAIEFRSFDETERGGLLVEDGEGDNVLQDLLNSSSNLSLDDHRHQHVDTTVVAVLIRLRRSGYLVQEDIQQYYLMHQLCQATHLPEQRFRFMTEWCPSALLRTNLSGELPFHWGTHNIRKFRVVLDGYFRFYPRWKGINALFTIDNDGDTPFLLACEELTHSKVMEVVEELLVRYTANNGRVNTNYNTNNGNAMILAASDDTISLDGLFFLIRRQPDSMLSMLRHRNNNNNDRINTNNTGNTDNGSNDNHNNGSESTRKRKRN